MLVSDFMITVSVMNSGGSRRAPVVRDGALQGPTLRIEQSFLIVVVAIAIAAAVWTVHAVALLVGLVLSVVFGAFVLARAARNASSMSTVTVRTGATVPRGREAGTWICCSGALEDRRCNEWQR